MNTAENQNQLNEVSMLSLVQDPETLTQEQALLRMRQIVGKNKNLAANIYDNKLNKEERKVLCVASGLSRAECQGATGINKTFNELSEDARLSIKRGLVKIGQIVDLFRNAHAMSDKHFLDQNSVKKVDAKSTKHPTREYTSSSNIPQSYEELQQNLQEGEK